MLYCATFQASRRKRDFRLQAAWVIYLRDSQLHATVVLNCAKFQTSRSVGVLLCESSGFTQRGCFTVRDFRLHATWMFYCSRSRASRRGYLFLWDFRNYAAWMFYCARYQVYAGGEISRFSQHESFAVWDFSLHAAGVLTVRDFLFHAAGVFH
jgi:hypothetical protein